ncbi:MAG TPA: prenyltransferase [Dehalococcoidales bacterium]|nr:prenyltransferase [Dehalococcoidales bacterium]HUV53101.1 prenyltransferase [Dehalococcoidia bacterium]
MSKVKAHLWTLPRWFASPFFGSNLLLGAVFAGGINANAWIGLAAGLLVMAGGHSFNSFLDYSWTGLDKGEIENRSAEKDYCGGQNIIEAGIVTPREVLLNAVGWYVLSALPIIYLAVKVGWPILPVWVLSMLITFWYSKAKFNWTHELALFMGAGPLAALIGMYSVTPTPEWWIGIVAGAPAGLILSFVGLPLDEYPDAEANLKKGVKSIAYKVWQYDIDLGFYLLTWIMFVYLLQVFLIAVGILAPLTWLTFVLVPMFMAAVVFLKRDFRKAAGILVIIGTCYPVLMLLGQIFGG